MKKYKGIILGFIAGTIVSSLGLMAYGNSIPISAFEDNRIGYIFGESDRKLPDGDFTTVVYNDRTYVPVSFFTENLGGKAIWNHETRTVIVDIPEKIVEIEKIVEVEKIIEVPSKDQYRRLPISHLEKDLSVNITNYDKYERGNSSRFYIEVENRGQDPWQIQLYDTEFVASNGTSYKVDRSTPISEFDVQFFNDIRQDQRIGGFLTIDKIPDGIKEGTLKLKVIKNTFERDIVNIELPIGF